MKFAHSLDIPSKELAYPTFRKGKSSSILLFQGDMLLPRSNFFDSRENSHGIGLLSPLPTHPPAKRFVFCWRLQHDFLTQRCCFYGGAVPKRFACFQDVPRVRFVSKKDGIFLHKLGVDFSTVAIKMSTTPRFIHRRVLL